MTTFLGSFINKKVERKTREYIASYCKGMPVKDFRYAAENNLDILLEILNRVFLKPGEEKTARKKAARYRHLVEILATPENIIRVTAEVAPEHAKVLRQHPAWLSRQIRSAMSQVFGA